MAQLGTSIHVEDGWLTSRLVWPDSSMTPVALDLSWKWRLRKLDLYDGTVGKRIDALGGIADVVQGLAILAGRTGQDILPITGGSIADLLPWEAPEARFVDRS